MLKIYQDDLTPQTGNCFAACVASILELPLHTVPNFCNTSDPWWPAFQQWLAQRGLTAVEIHNKRRSGLRPVTPGVPVVITGPSSRGSWQHSVVGIACDEGFEFIHDPNPEGGFLGGAKPQRILFFASTHPEGQCKPSSSKLNTTLIGASFA